MQFKRIIAKWLDNNAIKSIQATTEHEIGFKEGYIACMKQVQALYNNHKTEWTHVTEELPQTYDALGNASTYLMFVDTDGYVHKEGIYHADGTWSDVGAKRKFKAVYWTDIPNTPNI